MQDTRTSQTRRSGEQSRQTTGRKGSSRRHLPPGRWPASGADKSRDQDLPIPGRRCRLPDFAALFSHLLFGIADTGCRIWRRQWTKTGSCRPCCPQERITSRLEGVKYRALKGSVFRSLRGSTIRARLSLSGGAAEKTMSRPRERHGQPMVRQLPVQQGTAGL